MYTTTSFRLGPEFTPKVIRRLMILIISISLGMALIDPVIQYFWKDPGSLRWLALSWPGLRSFFLWQPITALFFYPTFGALSFGYLIGLAFTAYLLWVFGSDLVERVGERQFLFFFFFCGITATLLTLLLMPLIGQYGILAGPTPALIALMIAWVFFHAETELLLFFLIPVKAKWLLFGGLGALLLINLSQLDFVDFFLYLFATLIGYLYVVMVWGLHSPVTDMYRFELKAMTFSNRVQGWFRKSSDRKKKKGSIISFPFGKEKPLEDEAFIDAMLEKISKKGEGSLTRAERERMDSIVKNRSR